MNLVDESVAEAVLLTAASLSGWCEQIQASWCDSGCVDSGATAADRGITCEL